MSKRKALYTEDVERSLSAAGLLPDVYRYVWYQGSENYGAHSMRFSFAGITMWFSYRTLIAFRVNGSPQIVRENSWGPTSGRHIREAAKNYVTQRYPEEEFLILFNNALRELGISKLPELCIYEEKPKPPKRKALRKIGLKKKGEPVFPPVEPKVPKPKKPLTRLEKLAAQLDFEDYREEFPDEVL